VWLRGGGTKPALSAPLEGIVALELSGLSGVREYDPGEFTFTALAGTPLADVSALLSEHGQYLPFDPPFVERGATLGGTVASGLSGPGRYRYGGVRDFILGVTLVDAAGQIVKGGGKVVKNAAGFDLPKLMTGSLGQLGVLAEVTFKVFPRPQAYATLRFQCASLESGVKALYTLTGLPFDLEALELLPDGHGAATLIVRLGGLAGALPVRLERVAQRLGSGEVIEGEADAALWRAAREFAWVPAQHALIKVPLTPARLNAFDTAVAGYSAPRRYSAGGQAAWVAWPAALSDLHELLVAQGLSGLVVWGPPGRPLLGVSGGGAFAQRVKAALDPAKKFGEW
jgi:glycolate oxidase FAD binding subunit